MPDQGIVRPSGATGAPRALPPLRVRSAIPSGDVHPAVLPAPGGVTVSVGPDGRPGSAPVVRAGSFDGPLALLLTLIEQRQLDVLTVPLGDLTAAYLDALATLPGDRLRNISGFIAIASQLIVIKSRALLPRPPSAVAVTPEAEDPERALRERLIVYKRFRDAAAWLEARAASGVALFHREAAAARSAAETGARPPAEPPLDPELLVAALTRSIAFVPAPEPAPEVLARAVTLADRAALIRATLATAPQLVLQDLLSGVTDRIVIAVTFLAMLELVKIRELVVEQDVPWGPIRCRSTTPIERRDGRPANDAAADT